MDTLLVSCRYVFVRKYSYKCGIVELSKGSQQSLVVINVINLVSQVIYRFVKIKEILGGDSFGLGNKENEILNKTIFVFFVIILESLKVKFELMYKSQ